MGQNGTVQYIAKLVSFPNNSIKLLCEMAPKPVAFRNYMTKLQSVILKEITLHSNGLLYIRVL